MLRAVGHDNNVPFISLRFSVSLGLWTQGRQPVSSLHVLGVVFQHAVPDTGKYSNNFFFFGGGGGGDFGTVQSVVDFNDLVLPA